MFCSKCEEPLLERVYAALSSQGSFIILMKSINDAPTKNLSKANIKNERFTACSEDAYERGFHPNSLKNLKPFPKGVSGNPAWKIS